ncbi:MAG: hypothetical protein U0R44_02555 [Candidatus Micrarchaeia archaeon]
MGKLTIIISDDIEDKLRKKAAAKFGLRKGSIRNAIEEALLEWFRRDA